MRCHVQPARTFADAHLFHNRTGSEIRNVHHHAAPSAPVLLAVTAAGTGRCGAPDLELVALAAHGSQSGWTDASRRGLLRGRISVDVGLVNMQRNVLERSRGADGHADDGRSGTCPRGRQTELLLTEKVHLNGRRRNLYKCQCLLDVSGSHRRFRRCVSVFNTGDTNDIADRDCALSRSSDRRPSIGIHEIQPWR